MADGAPDVAGIACRTGIFVDEMRTKILRDGILILEQRTQVSSAFENYNKGEIRK